MLTLCQMKIYLKKNKLRNKWQYKKEIVKCEVTRQSCKPFHERMTDNTRK